MIDNLPLISPLLQFPDSDTFYFVTLLQRRKENKDKQIGCDNRFIKDYYIKSLDYLTSRYEEIKAICNALNCRAYISLSPRSFRKVAFSSLSYMAKRIEQGNFECLKGAYNHCVGISSNKDGRLWMIDLDKGVDLHKEEDIQNFLLTLRPQGDKLIAKIPSKSGLHLICKPFNYQEFKKEFQNTVVYKNNPTNLYIP